MNTPMHSRLGLTAWHSLSATDKAAWNLAPELPPGAPECLRRQPAPSSVDDKISLYSNSLDYLGWRQEDTHAFPPWLMPDGRPLPHGAVGPVGDPVWSGEQFWDNHGWRQIPRYFIPRLLDEVRDGELHKAELTLAAMLHFFHDSANLGHLHPNRLFHEFRQPDPSRILYFHRIFDNVEPELHPVEPLLLGRTAAEVVQRLGFMVERNHLRTRQIMIDSIDAAQAGDDGKLARLFAPIYQDVVLQTASLLHTAIVLAGSTVPKTPPLPLIEAVPRYIHPGGPYASLVPVNQHVVDGRMVPLEYGGQPRTGYGMCAFHSIRFLLEPGAFDLVKGAIALSDRYTDGQDPDLPVTFIVATAPVWDTQVVSDLHYAPPFRERFSLELVPGQPPVPFAVELEDAETLLLAVRPEVKRIDGHDRCAFPHILLIDPRLTHHPV